MLRSATEGNLPVLPGIRQYIPKRKTFGRQTLFDIGADGVMLQRETLVRQSSAPSSQQMSSENENSRSLLRPQSALGLSATSSLSVFEDADVSAPKALRSTVRKKQQTLDSLKALAPLTVNVPYEEFMDIAFRGDVQTLNGLIQRRCNFDDKNTWGNVHLGLDSGFDSFHY